MQLAAVDVVVILAYIVGVVWLGLRLGRGQNSARAYTIGNRDLPWFAVLLSIVATETSTVTFLSVPGIAYAGDMTWLQLPIGFAIGRLVVAWFLLPRYFEGELITAYEVLDRRFGGVVKQAASALFLVTRTLADGLRLYLSAIVVQALAGIELPLAIVATGAVTILYTFHGGIRAVVWTDLIQFFVYVGGAAVAFAILVGDVDGGLATILAQTEKLQVFNVDPARGMTLWTGVIGGAFIALGTHGADQMMVQRYLCARSRGDATKALTLSGVLVVAQFAFFLLIGVGLAVYYTQHPPATPFQRNDQVFASFVLERMPSGALGIVLGAIFAAAMSTLSSSLNSCATSAVHDIWVPWFRPDATDAQRLGATRFATIVFGVLQIAVGIGGSSLGGSVVDHVITIAAFTTGLVLGLFFLGQWTRANQRDAFVGFAAGLVATSVTYAWNLVPPVWLACIGSLTTFAVGTLTHLLLKGTPR
jgi:SSS family solute:Na+ symporter